MKEDVLFIGIGQAGSNLAYEMKQRGFQTFYINSTNDDVDLLDIDDNLKYHIPGATGCGRNRAKALNYTKEHFNNIDNIIMTKFPMFKHIYICFSTGGGTGSGISPVLLGILSQKYPNKNFGYVTILPNSSESVDIKTNSLECYSQLQKLTHINNTLFLDNNSSVNDFIVINKIFADEFEKFIEITSYKSVRGNIDDDELEKLIATKGNVVFANKIGDTIEVTPIFSKPEKTIQKAFVINNDDPITISMLENTFSKPARLFSGYNEDIKNSYAGLFGLPMPKSRIMEIQEEVLKDNEEIVIVKDEQMDFVIPDSLKQNNVQKKDKLKSIDINSIFDEFM
ncbi:hypothetical protein [Peptoanaerobacter stomatis]